MINKGYFIEQIHVQSVDGRRRWDRMVRCGVFKQMSKFTYALEMDKEG